MIEFMNKALIFNYKSGIYNSIKFKVYALLQESEARTDTLRAKAKEKQRHCDQVYEKKG